jgi:hypothetical protein
MSALECEYIRRERRRMRWYWLREDLIMITVLWIAPLMFVAIGVPLFFMATTWAFNVSCR